ncbi:MAG: hypothetical protein QOH88_1468 [Verrucomicrobiota bacterium]|jgi:hypothetical protein
MSELNFFVVGDAALRRPLPFIGSDDATRVGQRSALSLPIAKNALG